LEIGYWILENEVIVENPKPEVQNNHPRRSLFICPVLDYRLMIYDWIFNRNPITLSFITSSTWSIF
jgi:hypothetical protein